MSSMKKNWLLLMFFCFGMTFHSFAQSVTDAVPNDVINSIRSGNAVQLAKNFNQAIDLTVPENDGTFSRIQAEVIMKDFFKKYPPKSFTVKQQGSSADGSRFTIGTYITTSNKTYRTYFLVKNTGSGPFVQLLQFEEE